MTTLKQKRDTAGKIVGLGADTLIPITKEPDGPTPVSGVSDIGEVIASMSLVTTAQLSGYAAASHGHDITEITGTVAFTQGEKDKLAGLDGSRFLGTYVDLSALQTAHPSPAEGSYAHVDAGVGQDVEVYIWDNDDAQYALQQGAGTAETAASIKTKYESNADTNVYDDASKAKVDALPSGGVQDPGANVKTNMADADKMPFIDADAAAGSEAASITKANFLTNEVQPLIDAAAGGGQSVTPHDLGTPTGNVTPDFANSSVQFGVNDGAFTLLKPTGNGRLSLELTNGPNAAVPDISNFDFWDGSVLYDVTDRKRVVADIVSNQNVAYGLWRVMDTLAALPNTTTPLRMLQAIPAGFPVPIHHLQFDNPTHSKAIYANMQADGGDIRVFADAAKTTRLPVYVLAVDTGSGTEKLMGFFKNPSAMNVGDKVYVETGNPGGSLVQPAASDPFGLNSVWTAYQRVVQLGHDGVAAWASELTGNGGVTLDNDDNAPSTLLNDWPAAQFHTNSGGDSITLDGYVDDPVAWTATFLVRNSIFTSQRNFLQKAAGGFEIELNEDYPTGAPTRAFLLRQKWNGGDVIEWHAPYGASNQWKMLSVAYDHSSAANDPAMMVNGVAQAVTELTAPTGSYVADATEMRLQYDTTNHFNGGAIGNTSQVRIAHAQRDEAWEALVWDGFNNPAGVAEAEALA